MDCISLLRMLSVFSIISCHIMQFYNSELAWWFNTGVQVFLLISGFLYSQKNIKIKEFYKKNIVKILFDYYVYLFIILFIYLLFKRNYLNLSGIIRAIIGKGGGIKGLEHMWFISTIIICYFLTPFLQKLKNEIKNKFFLFISFLILMLCIEPSPYFPGTWINCYIIGYLFGTFSFNEKYKTIFNKISFFILIVGIITNIFQIYLQYFLNIRYETKIEFLLYRYNKIFLALGIFIVFIIYLKRYKSKNQYIKNLYKYMNKYSYDIYLTHHIYILGPFSILNFSIFKEKMLGVITVFFLSISSGIILNILCEKIKLFFKLFKKE